MFRKVHLAEKWEHIQPITLIAAVIIYIPFLIQNGLFLAYKTNVVDLPTFYTAAHQVFQHGKPPYNMAELGALFPGHDVPPFLYLPPALFFFFPLSLLSWKQAVILAIISNHLILLSCIYLSYQLTTGNNPIRQNLTFLFTVAIATSFGPITKTIIFGQVNIVLLLLILLFWHFQNQKSNLVASIFLAASVFLKIYPVLLVLVLLITRNYKTIAHTFWIGVVVSALSFFILPKHTWENWFEHVASNSGYMKNMEFNGKVFKSPGAHLNQSINGGIARLFIHEPFEPGEQPTIQSAKETQKAKLIVQALCASIFFISLYFIWVNFKKSPEELAGAMIIFLPLMYLIAPVSWDIHLAYLLPLYPYFIYRKWDFQLTKAGTILGILLFSTAAVLVYMPMSPHYYIYSPKCLGVLGLWFLAIYCAHSDTNKARSRTTQKA